MTRLFLAVLLLAAGRNGGSGVGQSIWEATSGRPIRELKNKPADAKVTSSNCHANYSSTTATVYTCTVMWD